VLQAGTIYVAPPDCQMRVHSERVELTKGPRENGHRPAIDPLFRSAARTHDSHAAGVVLSGTLDDGTAGLFDIKQAGGATLVQDPDEALFPGMPLNAIEYVEPDYIQPIEDLVDTLVRLTATGRVARRKEGVMDEPAPDPSAEDAQPGELAPFSCPDCGGTLWETRNGDVTSYRCRVGHAFSISALAAKNADAVEHALWVAYRALEEKAAVSRRVARRLTGADRHASATRFERQADVAARQAGVLKTVLDELQPAIDPVEAAAQASG
jgi:two-component system chemotaxis response regulator CheB